MSIIYYISKNLHIYYNDTEYLTIELERSRGLRSNSGIDEDDENYEQKLADLINNDLCKYLNEPITIYKDNSFTKVLCETKYKTLVENKMVCYGKTWSDIIKIVKIEQAGIECSNQALVYQNRRAPMYQTW